MINTLAISPCPNDTFAFHGWIHEKTPFTSPKKVILEDVQSLNQHALKGVFPVSKISFACLGKILDNYVALPAGAALGYGSGPKIIANTPFSPDEITKKKIAVPGKDTTAFLLLKVLFDIDDKNILFCPYEKINSLIKKGIADCGLIIHETRFTFRSEGFFEIADLGALWEKQVSLPLPLGCIVAKRSLGNKALETLTGAIHSSLDYGWKNRSSSYDYILNHSQEKNIDVIEKHINLYVNKESSQLSDIGIQAIDMLLCLGREKGLLPKFSENWLFEAQNMDSLI